MFIYMLHVHRIQCTAPFALKHVLLLQTVSWKSNFSETGLDKEIKFSSGTIRCREFFLISTCNEVSLILITAVECCVCHGRYCFNVQSIKLLSYHSWRAQTCTPFLSGKKRTREILWITSKKVAAHIFPDPRFSGDNYGEVDELWRYARLMMLWTNPLCEPASCFNNREAAREMRSDFYVMSGRHPVLFTPRPVKGCVQIWEIRGSVSRPVYPQVPEDDVFLFTPRLCNNRQTHGPRCRSSSWAEQQSDDSGDVSRASSPSAVWYHAHWYVLHAAGRRGWLWFTPSLTDSCFVCTGKQNVCFTDCSPSNTGHLLEEE